MRTEAERRAARERVDVSILLRLPRIVGTPEDVAAEIERRIVAKSVGFVYVGAHVRKRPTRSKKHHARRAA